MKTDYVENALVAKTKGLKLNGSGFKNGESKGNKSGKKSGEVKQGSAVDKYPPCSICKKKYDTEKYYWHRPNVKCRAYQ